VALAALLFCFVIVVPYLRDRINRLFDESGERRILQHTTSTGSSTGDAAEGSSFFAFASPYAYFRRVWNKLRPGRAVEVSEDVDSESASLRKTPSLSSNCFTFRRRCCCRVPPPVVLWANPSAGTTRLTAMSAAALVSQRKG
jgi:hypothetical protein